MRVSPPRSRLSYRRDGIEQPSCEHARSRCVVSTEAVRWQNAANSYLKGYLAENAIIKELNAALVSEKQQIASLEAKCKCKP
jgi:hypothetical protein